MRLERQWAQVSIIFLVIAMAIGVVLRLSFTNPVPGLNFVFVKHAHSHVVLLGWAFNAILAIIFHNYKAVLNPVWTKRLFWLMQVAIVGMLFTFPFQGYALYSIFFSTLHIVASYVFVAQFLWKTRKDNSWLTEWVSISLWFYVLSTFGPFALGPISAKGLQDTPYYTLAIYFYLHFFYNGFFTMVILVLLIQFAQVSGRNKLSKNTGLGIRMIAWSIVPSYSLSMSCFYQWDWLYAIGFISAIVQLIGFYYIAADAWKNRALNGRSKISPNFMIVGWVCLGAKFVLQVASSIPMIATYICGVHAVVIGYLHLVFIGFITFSLVGLLLTNRLINLKQSFSNLIFWPLLTGFLFTEILIFYPSTQVYTGWPSIPHYFHWLTFFSAVMLVGVLSLFFSKNKMD